MNNRIIAKALVAATAALLVAPSGFALSTYSQDFESLTQADPNALGNNGWLVYGNIFDPTNTIYLGGYGPYPAPNGGPGFSAVASGQGGPGQGAQQLVVYSNYNDGNHAAGNRVEANVFQEQTIGAGDLGQTYQFTFDAKMGDLQPDSTALAFIKTLDPFNNYATTNFITADMTAIPGTWGTYVLSLVINNNLDGQILQFGFSNNASLYTPSGVFYDNVNFAAVPVPAALWLFGSALGVLGVVRRSRSAA